MFRKAMSGDKATYGCGGATCRSCFFQLPRATRPSVHVPYNPILVRVFLPFRFAICTATVLFWTVRWAIFLWVPLSKPWAGCCDSSDVIMYRVSYKATHDAIGGRASPRRRTNSPACALITAHGCTLLWRSNRFVKNRVVLQSGIIPLSKEITDPS